MMNFDNIVPGLKIFGEGIESRLKVNSGVRLAESPDFASSAYLANSDWKLPTQDQLSSLMNRATESQNQFENIAVWKIPSEINSFFDNLRFAITKHNNELVVKNLFDHPNYKKGIQKLIEHCVSICPESNPKFLGHYSRAQGMKSNSRGKDGKYIGLHIDTWGAPKILHRTGCPVRLCINLGPETRYFHFINISVNQMLREKLPVDDDPDKFIQNFLDYNPNYPVTRLEVNPGEAYIAPTELIIHDAVTLEKNFVDCSSTIHGEFSEGFIQKLLSAN